MTICDICGTKKEVHLFIITFDQTSLTKDFCRNCYIALLKFIEAKGEIIKNDN